MQELLQLPLQVQATLVAGYLGYILLRRDYRKTEKLVDVWMLILVLGLPTALAVQLSDSPAAYLMIPSGMLIAFVWVKCCEDRWRDYLYDKKVSNSLNIGDVWKTLSSHKGIEATQISLIDKDEKAYLCDNPSKFEGEPFAPFIMDDDSIAFYVTHAKGKEDPDWKKIHDVKMSPEFGSALTYFPRADIKLLDIRYTKQ